MKSRSIRLVYEFALIAIFLSPTANADLILLNQFNPGEVGVIVGVAFDQTTDSVWVYGASNANLHQYSRTGTFLSSIARPGESANDFDIDFASTALTLNSVNIAAGTLLVTNGESGTADIYAVNKADGSVLASLATGFGNSHVVGGSYDPATNSFFLVQDRQPGGTASDNLVARINPNDGSLFSSFYTDALSGFTVNFGDIEVGANGNLFVVSSDESTIAEFTTTGSFVQSLVLPAGVGSLSGIAFDEARGEAWVTSNTGVVYQLGGVSPEPSTVVTRATRYIGATGASASASLATDKVALLPGQTSTFANYTNYSRGLNGIVVDVNGLPSGTTNAQMLASLQFASWNGINAGGFVALPGTVAPTIAIAAGGGAGGSARVTVTFPDNALQNTWLRVTILANANTGLAANDVFYFGNVMGELDFGNTATRLRVNGQDAAFLLGNQSPGANSAPVTNKFDLNRDGRVNGQDYAFLLANQQAAGIVAPISAP